MASTFGLIAEEFLDDLEAIRALVVTFSDQSHPAKMRIAAANSATLLVAATFEEFVREMAREYARHVVSKAQSFEKVPAKLVSVAWKRTMESLSKIRIKGQENSPSQENPFVVAQTKFSSIYDFCRGDLTKDIYRELIRNESNMLPGEVNGLFKVSGLGDICTKLSDKLPILEFFGESDSGRAHGRLLEAAEDFFERRNAIAHALNPGQSNAPDQIIKDIDLLESFGRALCETLDGYVPNESALATETPIREI